MLFVNAQASSPFCARTWKMWKWRITLLIPVNFHSNQVRTNERFSLMYRQQLDYVRVCLRWRSTAQIFVYIQCAVPHRALTDSNKLRRAANGNPALDSCSCSLHYFYFDKPTWGEPSLFGLALALVFSRLEKFHF